MSSKTPPSEPVPSHFDFHVRKWLAVVTVILVPLQFYSLIMEWPDFVSGSVSLPEIALLVAAGIPIVIGLVILWKAFYGVLRTDTALSFHERFFWCVALLNVPYGLLLFYWLVYKKPRVINKA